MTVRATMTHLERFQAVMNFQPVDRLPLLEWATWWDQTIQRWRGEGLPQMPDEDLAVYFGLDPYWQHWFNPVASAAPEPSEFGHGFVKNMDEYLAVKPHLYLAADKAFERVEQMCLRQSQDKALVWFTLEGFFWFPRRLLGIENHLYAFYDQSELMHKICDDLLDYHLGVINRLKQNRSVPAFMTFAEDMSYNHGPMLSKQLFDEFLAPRYRKIVPLLQEAGIVVFVDSDGDVKELSQWLAEVGIEAILPLERQAGCDIAQLRQTQPRLRIIGHFDKTTMHKGESVVRQEFERLLPTMKAGGFIPSVDHQTPPGVSLEQYYSYLRLLKEYAQFAVK